MSRKYPPERFQVFISYTTREEEVSEFKPLLDFFLNNYLRPIIENAIGIPPVFYDGYMLHKKGGHGLSDLELEETLNYAIKDSEVMLAFISPHYFSSDWCRFEWDTMRAKKRRPWYDISKIPAGLKRYGILEAEMFNQYGRNEVETSPTLLSRFLNWLDFFPQPGIGSGCELFPILWKNGVDFPKGALPFSLENADFTKFYNVIKGRGSYYKDDLLKSFVIGTSIVEFDLPEKLDHWHPADWTSILAPFKEWRAGVEHLAYHGSVSTDLYNSVELEFKKSLASMVETAQDIAQILLRRRREYGRSVRMP